MRCGSHRRRGRPCRRAARSRGSVGSTRNRSGTANGVWLKWTRRRSGRSSRNERREQREVVVLHEHRGIVGRFLGHGRRRTLAFTARYAAHASREVGVETRSAGQVEQVVVHEPQRRVAHDVVGQVGTRADRCRAAGRGSPRPRWRPAAAAARSASEIAAAIQVASFPASEASPETSPPAPRRATNAPPSSRNDTGPRFETITTGRSATPEPYAATAPLTMGCCGACAWSQLRTSSRERHRLLRSLPRSRALPAKAGGTCDRAPMSDGGEGFIDAFGGSNRTMTVSGPLGDPVEAAWRFTHDLAVVEMAAAAGLTLAGGADAQRPHRRVDPRCRRTDRAWRSRAVPSGCSSVSADRPPPTGAWARLRALFPPRALPRRRLGRGHRRAHQVRRRGRGVRPPEGRHTRSGRAASPPARTAGAAPISTTTASTCGTSRDRARPADWPAGWRPSAPSCSPVSTWWPTKWSSYERIEGADLVITGEGLPRRRILRRQSSWRCL